MISVAEELNMELLPLEELEELEAKRRTKSLKPEQLQCVLITLIAASLVQLWPVPLC